MTLQHALSEFFATPPVFVGTVCTLATGIVILAYLEYSEQHQVNGMPGDSELGEVMPVEDQGTVTWRDLWPYLSLLERSLIPVVLLEACLLSLCRDDEAGEKLQDDFNRALRKRVRLRRCRQH